MHSSHTPKAHRRNKSHRRAPPAVTVRGRRHASSHSCPRPPTGRRSHPHSRRSPYATLGAMVRRPLRGSPSVTPRIRPHLPSIEVPRVALVYNLTACAPIPRVPLTRSCPALKSRWAGVGVASRPTGSPRSWSVARLSTLVSVRRVDPRGRYEVVPRLRIYETTVSQFRPVERHTTGGRYLRACETC